MGTNIVRVGDVTLSGSERISWTFSSGGAASMSPLIVCQGDDAKLQNVTNPTTLTFQSGNTDQTIEEVYIIRAGRGIGPNKRLWTLADRRIVLQKVLVDINFNIMRASNQFKLQKKVPLNVAQISGIPLNMWVKNTCQDEKTFGSAAPRFALMDEDSFVPWTALEALKYLTSDKGFGKDQLILDFEGGRFKFGEVDISKTKERKAILKRYNGRTSWGRVVSDLLREARHGLYVDPRGKFVLYDLEPTEDIASGAGQYQGSFGKPVKQDNSRIRPDFCSIYFPKLNSVRFDYDEKDDFLKSPTKLPGKPELKIRAAFIMPQRVKNPSGGFYERGEVVPQVDALEAWRKDAVNQVPNGLGNDLWAVEHIRRYWMQRGLGHLYQIDFDRMGFKNPVLEARVSEVYSNYRQLFQISPELMDLIDDWFVTDVEIVDSRTGTKQMSPVFLDYFGWDSFKTRGRKGASRPGPNSSAINPKSGGVETVMGIRIHALGGNINTPVKDLKLEDLVSENKRSGAPAVIQIVNKALGTFRISFVNDLSGETTHYMPGLPSKIPNMMLAMFGVPATIAESELEQTYRVIVKLSIKWRTPNNLERFHVVKERAKDHTKAEAKGPEQQMFFPGYEAAFGWQDGRTKLVKLSDQYIMVGDKILNKSVCDEIANAEAQRLYFGYEDRVLGSWRAAEWNPAAIGHLPHNHVRSVSPVFVNGAMECEISGEVPPPKPSAWELLGPDTRNLLGGFMEHTLIPGENRSST